MQDLSSAFAREGYVTCGTWSQSRG